MKYNRKTKCIRPAISHALWIQDFHRAYHEITHGTTLEILKLLPLPINSHCRRPYRVEYTGSLLTSEVKRRRARLVLGWGTAREDLRVLSAIYSFASVSNVRTWRFITPACKVHQSSLAWSHLVQKVLSNAALTCCHLKHKSNYLQNRG
jgi:hypothetical protein